MLKPVYVSQPEDQIEHDQQKHIYEALSFLSMDYIVPFYQFLLVPTEEPQYFKEKIRNILTQNVFEIDMTWKKTTKSLAYYFYQMIPIDRYFNKVHAKHLLWWIENIYITVPKTSRTYFDWQGCLLYNQNGEEMWRQLLLPDRLSGKARQFFIRLIDDDAKDALEDIVYQKERSLWDVNVFVKEKLYMEYGNLTTTISLAFRQLRYRYFMGWLAQQLTMDEIEVFRQACQIAVRKRYGSDGMVLPDIATQFLPDMDDPNKIFNKDIL